MRQEGRCPAVKDDFSIEKSTSESCQNVFGLGQVQLLVSHYPQSIKPWPPVKAR